VTLAGPQWRFRDDGRSHFDYRDDIVVTCPNCAAAGRIVPFGGTLQTPVARRVRRRACIFYFTAGADTRPDAANRRSTRALRACRKGRMLPIEARPQAHTEE
jgi:hypothetical protein